MNCNNCGTTNNFGANFCIRCGESLLSQQVVNQPVGQSVQSSQMGQFHEQQAAQPVQSQVQSIQQPVMMNNEKNGNVQSLKFFKYIVAILLNPFQTFKSEETKLCVPKNSIILTLIVLGIITLKKFIDGVLSVVRVRNFWTRQTSWQWENIQNIDFGLIGKYLLIYAVIILSITVVYYLASLVVKKNIDFFKMLSITSSAMVPYIVFSMVLAPFIVEMSLFLYIVTSIIGTIYSLLIIFEFVNDSIKLNKKDNMIYLNLICISVLLSIGIWIYFKYTLLWLIR